MKQVLKQIELINFRNYKSLVREFELGVNWITGANGSGKTNLLEAVLVLSQGRSHRVVRQEDLVRWEEGAARIRGLVKAGKEESELEVNIWRAGVGKKVMSGKDYKVNGVGKLQRNYIGNLLTVWFGPEDLDLVSGGSGERRRFFDLVWGQVDPQYTRALREYEQALRRRNKLLLILAEGKTTRQAFYYFDEILISRGQYVYEKRKELVEYLNVFLMGSSNFGNLKLEYDQSVISQERLVKYQHAEVAAGVTLVGPQRDDLKILVDLSGFKSMRIFGSRGQQRMGALGLKMGEMEFLADKAGVRPLLLLDDVLSELDAKHKQVVVEVMEKQQTIVSGVEEF